MGLIQSVIEKAGIPTVSTSVLREVTTKLKLPRVLFVDRPLGYPLGEPGNAELQRRIVRRAMSMLEQAVHAPLMEDFQE